MKKRTILSLFILIICILSANVVFAEENNNETQYNVTAGSNSNQIQEVINNMNDGDTLSFAEGEYNDICVYIEKDINVKGNGAKLIGLNSSGINNSNIPEKIINKTKDGGYAIINLATLYVVNNSNVNIENLKLEALYENYNSTALFSQKSIINVKNCEIIGGSWGIYLQNSDNSKIVNNYVHDQLTTGIFSFESNKAIIKNNKVVNAKNHGIDVRHGSGSNVLVDNNTVIGAKEGIYIMHSKGHKVINNDIYDSKISAVTVYGARNILIENNILNNSKIGVLLANGFDNVTVGENINQLFKLPFPPSFQYFVVIADSKFNNDKSPVTIGTFSDGSENNISYINETNIIPRESITIDYDTLKVGTGNTYTVEPNATNDEIQVLINKLDDGDILSFSNATYNNICLYIEKNITILGNGATLTGLRSGGEGNTNIPEKIRNKTADGGYAIANLATLYVVNKSNVSISNLNLIGLNMSYPTAVIYAQKSKLNLIESTVKGASWGVYLHQSPNSIIAKNNILDQKTTGIIAFGSTNTKIVNNTIVDAKNHGIDVRHKSGTNVSVEGNTVIGSKEGIFIMHSKGHHVYNNKVLNSPTCGITVFGAENINVYNNTVKGSRMGILLARQYKDVAIKDNIFILDKLPFPPTFRYYIATAYQSFNKNSKYAEGVYSESDYSNESVTNSYADDIIMYYQNGTKYVVNFKNKDNSPCIGNNVSITINGKVYWRITDENGSVKMNINLDPKTYEVSAINPSTGDMVVSTIKVLPTLSASDVVKYFRNGTQYYVKLLDKQGKPLKNTNVELNINGVFYNRLTNNKGIAKLNINLDPREYIITAKNTADNCVISNKITVLSTINGSDIVKYFRNGTQYYANFVDAQGNPLKNTKVKFNINGVFYERTTDINGKARLNINLDPKDYVITAYNPFNGESFSNKIKVLPVLIGENINMKCRDGTSYEVRLLDGKGNSVSGKTISLNINGIFYNKVTDSNGIARLKINLDPKDYIITAQYGNAQISNKIKVNP